MEDNEMDVEEIREGVLAILKELHEDIDFDAEDMRRYIKPIR